MPRTMISEYKPILECLKKTECSKSKDFKLFEEEKKEKLLEKNKQFEELKRLYSDDFLKLFQEIKKIQYQFFMNVKDWKHINVHNDCIKQNCKEKIIDFFRNTTEVFNKQAKDAKLKLKNENLTFDQMQEYKDIIQLHKERKIKIKNINKWNNSQFDEVLNVLAGLEEAHIMK